MNEAANDHRIDVQRELTDLSRTIDILDGLWGEHGLDPEMQADLNVAIEEIVSNIIRHGGGEEEIQLTVRVEPAEVRVEIRDRSVAFNPLKHPAPDLNVRLEERRRGGLGILMTIKLMDRTAYERREGWNCFTMVKSRAPRTTR